MKKLYESTSSEAAAFFLRNENYSNLNLPPYFDFENVLKACSEALKDSNFAEHVVAAKTYTDKNLILVHNKDGQFAWRRFELIHPLLYVNLVNLITKPENWNLITKKFRRYDSISNIHCASNIDLTVGTRKSAVNNWWNNHEKRTIEESLSFNVMAETDLTDCYGSLYTHAIEWALAGKAEARASKGNVASLGKSIDEAIRFMRSHESIGIPQGSVLMDFIAELVLGYLDENLKTAMQASENQFRWKVIRFRDDYRIFTSTEAEAQVVLQFLSTEAAMLGFRMNPTKTRISSGFLRHAIKSDKRAAGALNVSSPSLKTLISVHEFADSHPNSSVIGMKFNEISKAIDAGRVARGDEAKAIIAVAADIAVKNPNAFSASMSLISRLITLVVPSERIEVMKMVSDRAKLMPNSAFTSLWLQRISLSLDKTLCECGTLGMRVGNRRSKVWSDDWLKTKSLKDLLLKAEVIDRKVLVAITPVVSLSEIWDDTNY